MSAPLVLLLGACLHAPMLLSDQSRPLPAGAVVAPEFTRVERCRSLLFHFIPIEPPYGFAELTDDARAGADALVDITVDTSTRWWLLGTTTCHHLRARRVVFLEARTGGAAPAAEDQGSPEDRAARSVVGVLYEDVGWDAGQMAGQFKRDVAAVSAYLAAGHTAGDALWEIRKLRVAQPELFPEDAIRLLDPSLR